MGSGKVFGSVLASATAGAILGILFAPDKGVETRRKLAEKCADLFDSVKDKYAEYSDEISDKYNDAKQKLSGLASEAKNLGKDLGNQAKDRVIEMKTDVE